MNEAQQAQADLAFMKALVEEGGRSQLAGGATFVAGGLLYGIQCLVQWLQVVGLIHLSDRVMVAFIIGITATFLVILLTVLWLGRKTGQRSVGTRALNAAFGGAGLANLVLCGSIGLVATRERSITIWLLYPVTLSVVLGAAWYVTFMVRRHAWLALVSLGWYATAVSLALLIGAIASYTLVLGLALVVLMAVPGAVMMRGARTSA